MNATWWSAVLQLTSVRPSHSINIIFQSQSKYIQYNRSFHQSKNITKAACLFTILCIWEIYKKPEGKGKERRGEEVLAIIDKVGCVWYFGPVMWVIYCAVLICFKYKVFVLEQFRISTACSLVQCLYWNVSLISVRKTGKKFQSGSFLQEMLPSLNTLISDSFHCVLLY